jgi:hypothetical protein
METIKELTARHKRELDELMKNCPHPLDKRSDWTIIYGPVHAFVIKQCTLCGSLMEKASPELASKIFQEEKEREAKYIAELNKERNERRMK